MKYYKHEASLETQLASPVIARALPDCCDRKQHYRTSPMVRGMVGESWYVTWLFMFSADMVFLMNKEYAGFLMEV